MGAREKILDKLQVTNDQLTEMIQAKVKAKGCTPTEALLEIHNEAFGVKTPSQKILATEKAETHTRKGFTKAVKDITKHRIAITGTAGSGKTYSALMLATHFGGKIALADTEYHSASNYANIFDFDEMLIEPDYTVDKYIEAIDLAIEGGYSTIILDSISHMWDGEGGLLEKRDAIVGRGDRNSFTAWDLLTPQYRKFVNHMLASPIHMIHTIRSKTEYSIDKDQFGKQR
jgi:hypothetical protein